jgi:hypothetical protein
VVELGLEYAFEEDLQRDSESYMRMCDDLRGLTKYNVPNEKLISVKAKISHHFG